MEKDILLLCPVFKERIWGGGRLRSDFGYDVPDDHIGECWAISAHPEGDCTVVSGPFEGYRLSELWETRRDLFGNAEGERFPLLIKIIDAMDDLSIQVHPDDEYARRYENGSLGKTECWYVLDCKADATIVIGHNAKDRAQAREMITRKQWDGFLREIPIKKGDFFQIPPGCLHAIKGGTLILETQQNSDITYRVYDYDRSQSGKPRSLHISKSMDVIDAPFKDRTEPPRVICKRNDLEIIRLVTCRHYTVDNVVLNGKAVLEQPYKFVNVSVIEGQGTVNGIPIRKGSHFILTGRCERASFEGNLTLITSYIE